MDSTTEISILRRDGFKANIANRKPRVAPGEIPPLPLPPFFFSFFISLPSECFFSRVHRVCNAKICTPATFLAAFLKPSHHQSLALSRFHGLLWIA